MPKLNEDTWYALKIRPKYEQISRRILLGKGYDVLLLTYTRPGAARKRTIELPLFPGYLFCRILPGVTAPAVTTPGVVSFVGRRGYPEPVADDEIEALRRISASPVARQPWRFLPYGSTVMVETGPLAGVRGILLSRANDRRLVVSIGLLQRSVAAVLDDDTRINRIAACPDSSGWMPQSVAA